MSAIVEWLESLAANDWNQTVGVMADGYEAGEPVQEVEPSTPRCCLGVLRTEFNPSATEEGFDDTEPDAGERDQYGLKRSGAVELMDMNDDKGLTFPQIALEVIKAPENYFFEETAEEIREHFWKL